MAARIDKRHSDETRAKIRTSQLINRLTDHALSERPLMDASQVAAAKILIAKTLPDLTATEISGPDGGPLLVSATPLTPAQWAAQHADDGGA